MKLRVRALKSFAIEAIGIIDFMITEGLLSGKHMGYLLKIPHSSLVKGSNSNAIVYLELKMYFDSEEQRNEQHKTNRRTSKSSPRH